MAKKQKGCTVCGAKSNWLIVTPADMDKAMAAGGDLRKALDDVPQYCAECDPTKGVRNVDQK